MPVFVQVETKRAESKTCREHSAFIMVGRHELASLKLTRVIPLLLCSGLTRPVALQLAAQTVKGAAAMQLEVTSTRYVCV